jgi:ketosteroid isomerase-like protein
MIGALLAKRRIPSGIDAINRRDLDAYLKDWTDDAVLVYPGQIPGAGGTHQGKAAIREFYEHDLEQFPKMKIRLSHIGVENIFDLFGNNTIFVEWEADVTNRDGFRIQNNGLSVLKVKGGKIFHLRMYIFDTGEIFKTAWGRATPNA